MPFYASNIGASPIEVGILYSVFSLSSILIRPLVGKWIDEKGRKNGIVTGLLLYSIVTLLFFIGKNYNYILIARIFQSIATSFIWISAHTMISDVSVIKERSRNFGIVDQSSNKGEFLGALIGFNILFNDFFSNPFKTVFMIFFITSLISIYYGIRKTKETLTESNIKQEMIRNSNEQFIKFLVIMGLLSFTTSTMAPIYLIYLKEHITSKLYLISYLFIPGAILSMFLPRFFGNFADNYGRKKLLISGMIVKAITISLIPLIRSYFLFMILYTITTIGSMLNFPAKNALVTELTGGNKKGKAYGNYHLAVGLGGMSGPMVGSIIYQYGKPQFIFYIQGIVLIISAIIINILIKENQIKNIHNNKYENTKFSLKLNKLDQVKK